MEKPNVKIIHKIYTSDSQNFDDFGLMLENKMHHDYGAFRRVWRSPENYLESGGHLSYLTVGGDVASCLFVGKNNYYGFYVHQEVVDSCYGFIGFYTKPNYRFLNYSRTLFEDFDKRFRLRKLYAMPRTRRIMSSLSDNEIEFA